MTEKRWTPEDEIALDRDIENSSRVVRERMLVRYAEARERQEREELRRERLRRLSFGLLGREGRASQ
jgi:hypothetical protein